MGVLRVILALSVLLSHVGGILISSGGRIALYFGTGGEVAVQCFYILSGFYMALILDGKYGRTAEGTLLFYTNRLFRLMPLYLLFLCVSFCLSYLATVSYSFPKQPATDLILHHDRLGIGALAYVALSNLFVFGHDLVIFFLGIDPADGSLFFTTRLPETPRLAIELFFIPQSWTLSLEFSFYLLAPFLVGRRAFPRCWWLRACACAPCSTQSVTGRATTTTSGRTRSSPTSSPSSSWARSPTSCIRE